MLKSPGGNHFNPACIPFNPAFIPSNGASIPSPGAFIPFNPTSIPFHGALIEINPLFIERDAMAKTAFSGAGGGFGTAAGTMDAQTPDGRRARAGPGAPGGNCANRPQIQGELRDEKISRFFLKCRRRLSDACA
jgi:hypothetical protein